MPKITTYASSRPADNVTTGNGILRTRRKTLFCADFRGVSGTVTFQVYYHADGFWFAHDDGSWTITADAGTSWELPKDTDLVCLIKTGGGTVNNAVYCLRDQEQ